MTYTKQTWNNDDANTPLSASRLNHIEDGIAAVETAIPDSPGDIGAAAASHTHTADGISDASTVGKSVLRGATAADIRTAISAGTSNFSGAYDNLTGTPTIPSTPADIGAAPATHTHTATQISDSSTIGRSLITAANQSAAQSILGISGGSGFNIATFIPFSSLAGATDDDKLDAGVTLAQSTTNKGRTILLDENRDYTFTRTKTVPSGFSIQGTFRPQDQPRSSRPVGNRILLRMAGASSGKGWLKIGSGQTFGVSIANLSIDGDSSSSLFDGSEDNGGVLWTSNFRDISIQNAKSVFGSKANRLLMTAVTRDGWWNINNVRETAWNDGGSDFFSQPTMMLVDSPSELLGFNEYLMTHSYMSNGFYSNVYCTAEGHGGILIQGSNNTSQNLFFDRFILEGRNENHPSPGALLRMEQGQASIRNSRFAFAMGKPSLITNRTDKGVIHVQGGFLQIESSTYERGFGVTAWVPPADPTLTTEVTEDVPFVYVASGAKVRVRNIMATGPTTGTRSWVGKPVVKQALPGLADCDDSVTLVTAQTAAAPNAAGDTTTGFANTGTSITINKPANIVDGSLMVAAVYGRNSSAVYTTPPSGWTAVAPSTDNTSAGVVRLYWKIASSEGSSYTWAGGGSGRHVGVITRITGSVSSPIDVASAAATGISGPERIILPSVTTTADLDMLFMIGTANGTSGTSPTFTAPAGATVVTSVQTTTGASESSMTVAVQSGVATGATGTKVLTASGTSSTGVGYQVAIKSAG